MNPHDQKTIDSLKSGKITHKVGHGKSMEPLIMDGSKQTLVPVLTKEDAEKLGCKPWKKGETVQEGELWYIDPEDLREGDAVFCKCKHIYTHEIHQIRGKQGEREWYIGRHDRKHYNGWTRTVYGKALTHRD